MSLRIPLALLSAICALVPGASAAGQNPSAARPVWSPSPSPSQRPPAAAPVGGAAWKLHLLKRASDFTDNTGQHVHMEVYSMLVPDGWQDNLIGPTGARDCAYNQGRLALAVVNPDQSTGVLILPAPATFWSSNFMARQQRAAFSRQFTTFTCSIQQPKPVAAQLEEVARTIFQNADVQGSLQPVPGLSEGIASVVQMANSRGSQITAQAGRLRISGSYKGKPVDAWVIGLQTQRPDSGGIVTDYPLLGIVFAPPGQLDPDEKLLMTVLSSFQLDPQYTGHTQTMIASELQMIHAAQQTVSRIQQQMAADNARAAQQQSAIIAGSNNYRSQVMNNVNSNRAAALDHSSQQFALYMGDQAVYHDPGSGSNVQLPSNYGHVWASTTGNTNDYLLTDSPSYNPNGRAGSAGWTELQPVR